jgi:hypothetical protein
MRDVVTDALRPLPAGYHDLFARVLQAAEPDNRVRAVWLSGSVGRGTADSGSDLDVVLAIAPAAFDGFAETWREWLSLVTPVVLARELPGLPGSFFSVTPDCLRLDVVAEPTGTVRTADLVGRLLVLDKEGAATAPVLAAEPVTAGPDPARLTEMAEEFLRQMTIFPAAVVARQDWSAKLTSRQRHVCASQPPARASSAGVLTAMRAAAAAFRQEAMAVFAANQVRWPADFDDAVRRYWERELGWAE